jgi:hypothetical protein
MQCDECSRLLNQFNMALADYKNAVGGVSGLHGFDLHFQASTERAEKARHRYEVSRAALQEHQQHHQNVAKREGV